MKVAYCLQNYCRPFSFARPKENGQKENDGEIENIFSKVKYQFRFDRILD